MPRKRNDTNYHTLQVWRFPQDLHSEFKRACRSRHRTMRSVLMEFARKYVSKHTEE